MVALLHPSLTLFPNYIGATCCPKIAVNKTRTYSEHGYMPSTIVGELWTHDIFPARISPM
jgi:hypothetical protein